MGGRQARGSFWMFLVVLLWSPLCSAQHSTSSQGSAPSPAEAQDVLVSPRRIPDRYVKQNTVPASTTVITAEQIKASGASTIQEVLSRVAGINFSDQQGFGLGSDGTLNLRGIVNSSRTNVLVLLDGVRQNRITGDEVHWQSIPVDQIERIEIIRGGGGLIYGEGALAGVINIIAKQAGENPIEVEAGAELGSYGWQKYTTGLKGRMEPLTYGLGYTRRLVEGYREFSWSRNTTVTAHAGIQPTSLLSGAIHVLHSEDTTAFPGGLTKVQTQQRRRQTNPFHGFNDNEIDQVSLDVVAGPWEGLSSAMTFFWRRWLQSSQDSIQFNSFTTTPSRGLSFHTNSEWSSTHLSNLAVSGVELTDDKATTGDRDAFEGPDSESNRQGYGLYAEDTLPLWDRLSLGGGLRYDRSRYQESLSFPSFTGTLRFQGFSPKAGVTYQLIPGWLDVFTSYARPFKAPNVDDFSARVPNFTGNADLKPQQADTYELGTRLAHKLLSGEVTWFYTKINDEILFNGLNSQNQNFDTRRVGLELSVKGESPSHRLRSYVNYTVVDAEFHKGPFAGNTVPGTPRQTMNAGLSVSPIDSFWILLDWQIVNDYFRINDMRNTLGKADNYGVLNLTLRYELPKKFVDRGAPATTAYLKIDNITNEEYVTFQSSNGANLLGAGEYPMPPTTFTGGVNIQF